ncbi:MAG: DUF4340 domain-containing protein [Gemmataceae bacterium]
MNFKTTYLLFALLAVMLSVLALVLYLGPTPPPGAENVFPSMHAKEGRIESKDIDKVVIERKVPDEATLVFERVDDNTWKITGPRPMPADSNNIRNLIDALIGARFEEENRPSSLRAGGLDNPQRVITLSGKDKEWKLTLGAVTPGTESALLYVLSSDRPTMPLGVSKTTFDAALENLPYFRARSLFGTDSRDFRTVRLALGKKPPVELKRTGDKWALVQPPYGDADAANLLTQLTGLTVDYRTDKENDFVKDAVTDLTPYHLNPAKGDVLTVTVVRGEGDKAVTTKAVLGVTKKVDKEEKYYAAFDEGQAKDVVKVPAAAVDALVKVVDDPNGVRNKNLLALESFKQPDAIDVDNSYGKLEFRKPDAAKPWQLYRGGAANNVDDAEVRKLIDELNRKDVISSFPDPKRKKELGLEKPEVVVKVWAESLQAADAKAKDAKPAFKKDVKPAAELRFGNRERDSVAVERVWGNDSTIALVPASLLDQLRKGPLAYVDRSIPPYNPGAAEEDVTKVELTRPGETFEITRENSTAPWKLVKPDALKGREANAEAMRGLLGELNRLSAKEIVAEKADAKDLAGTYELAKPAYRVAVTVTKDKKPTTHEFVFGKETAGKGVYLKLGNKDAIYLVGAEVLAALRRELRDTTVLSFEPDKVTGLTVRGWKTVVGAVTTLTFAQKDGKWTATSPPGYNLDAGKVTDLLQSLSRVQAERFVPAGKGLKLDEGAMQFEITLADKKVLELTVGAEDGASVYATSNQLKGDVFLVPKALVEAARKAPAYFSK